MADQEPDIVDSVTDATNGIGSEALAAISNLGGGSGSTASSVLSRLGATISGQAGGFAPKVITTVTKHGLAAIDRVEPILGVDRGYRAVARDANGLESIRTVLDLDPRAYDVTVTREDGVAIVEFVQQEPESETALPLGEDDADTATSSDATPEPVAPVKGAGLTTSRDRAPATTTANRTAPVARDGSRRVQSASNRAVSAGGHGQDVQRARAEAETAKAQAEAEKAQAEAEKAKAEAAAAKARAEAERAKAEADAGGVRDEPQTAEDGRSTVERSDSRDTTSQSELAPTASGGQDQHRIGTDRTGTTSQFVAACDLDSGFDTGRQAGENAAEATSSWRLRAEPNGSEANAVVETDSSDEDGFGEFTPATPAEGEPSEYADSDLIETCISVHDDRRTQDAVAVGGIENEETGKFQF